MPTLRARLATIAVLIALAAGCQAKLAAPVPIAVDPTRFPHDRHASLACTLCHGADRVEVAPGKDAHAPCANSGCHPSEFAAGAPPSKLCDVCHAPSAGPVLPFPRSASYQVWPSRFSHAAHLDAGKMEADVGFHVACVDCHPADPGTGAPTAPQHPTCARCHAPEVGLARAPAMTDCTGCHRDQGPVARDPRRVILGDLHFDHRNHTVDLAGTPIACVSCHRAIGAGTDDVRAAAPTVTTCVACHDDAHRVPSTMRMRQCETCHATRSETLGSLAPRDHLPPSERPIDHTLAFRSDHGDAASADPKRCAGCHTEMSGAATDTCDECHQVMRPADHTVTWRELDHGTEAASNGDRCATCHVVDYCVSCHRERPRSHLPVGSFSTDHGDLARQNPRACLTCHDPANDCDGCHAPAGTPRQ